MCPLWDYAKDGWKVIESMQEEVWSWGILYADGADREASTAKDINSQELLQALLGLLQIHDLHLEN